MEFIFIALTILGLSLFEAITSIDNAVINAEVLSGMEARARRWFLTWGFFFAVFVVRGLLPFLILWSAVPGLGPFDVLGVSFGGNEAAKNAIEETAPLLLLGGGIFLVFLFLNWLFLEPKHFGLRGEKFFQSQGAWFFALASIILVIIVWLSIRVDAMLALSAVIGSSAFFIIHGFRQYAEEQEERLMDKKNNISDISKVAYLEVLDTTFSIDGVIGAFAFTFSIPLILIGNGLGALVLRRLTISNIDRIKKYKFLKNGAMYSILFLGTIMIVDAFGVHIPIFVSPLITFGTVGFFFYKSKVDLDKIGEDIKVSIDNKE
ncbi:MAG: hypothetical protein A3A51_03840 [Candidatus Levybacteria bacterium RIFCSPLOWO2_01_FULL_39_10]|nr:MAG: hypothetical protein A3A51_03840 [Candidatus Levybacteria bacterium RIFCSPLOWO2_01_FULL_39_10]